MMYCPAHHESLPCAACAENLGRRADMTHRFQVVAVKCPDDVSGGAEWSCKYPTTCGEKGECCRNDDAVCTEHEPAGNINAETLKRHVSPGIPLSHELDRLRKYDEAAAEPSSLRLTLEFCATTAGEMAEWLTNSARCESPSFDAPPEPVSQFDSELLQASQEMFRLRDELIATLSKVGGAGTAPEPATGVTTAMMMEVAASMQPEAVSGHDPIVWTNADEKRLDDALAARNARRSPDPVVMLRFEFESMTAVEGWDRIYADYSKTFGRYPDAFMAQVVAQTKEDLFMWWGTHRDTIRAALVAFDNGVGAGAAPAGGVTTMQGLADYLRAMAYNQSAPDTLRQWASEVEAARAALSAQPEAGVESEFHKGARAMFDRLMFRAANHWHGNPKVNARCMGENKLIEEWAESALASLSGSSGEAPKPQQSQSAWATRQKLARDGARDVLAKEEAQEGGEPRGMALENALRNIEEACNYSPYREMDKWDAPLAQLIHHHARLLAAAALKEQ